jgi:predicted Zn-dependent protease
MRIPPFFTILLLVLCTGTHAATPETEQYTECTKTISTDPKGAYKRARAWYGQSKSVAAQHCMAMAHYELQEYEQAAFMLDQVLLGITPNQRQLWLFAKGQAASAYLAAGKADISQKHLDEALRWAADQGMDSEMVPLLAQRAALLARQGQQLKAVQDFDHALSIQPDAHAIRLQRAKLLLEMGKKAEAREDVQTVLTKEPENEEAKLLMAQLT